MQSNKIRTINLSIFLQMQLDSNSLKKWFLSQKRDLPWRSTKDPYAIWVSEIMLQQTQVSVVIPYFERWMESFPTVEALASSPKDVVIKAWEGLGYYSRARNLHEGAKFIVEHFNGKLPDNEEGLSQIKGIGPYTVGAIMSFAFHKKKAAVDGNVIRVLTRLFNIHDDIAKPKTVKHIREIAEMVLPEVEPWIISEALIELGATVCSKKPKCMQCPLKSSCKSFLKGEVDIVPFKSTKVKIECLFRNVAVIIADKKLLVRRSKSHEIMSDLYEFPFIETNCKIDNLSSDQSNFLKLPLKKILDLPEINHSFTRFKVKLNPAVFISGSTKSVEDYEWLSVEEIEQCAFSSGHRRLLESIKSKIIDIDKF